MSIYHRLPSVQHPEVTRAQIIDLSTPGVNLVPPDIQPFASKLDFQSIAGSGAPEDGAAKFWRQTGGYTGAIAIIDGVCSVGTDGNYHDIGITFDVLGPAAGMWLAQADVRPSFQKIPRIVAVEITEAEAKRLSFVAGASSPFPIAVRRIDGGWSFPSDFALRLNADGTADAFRYHEWKAEPAPAPVKTKVAAKPVVAPPPPPLVLVRKPHQWRIDPRTGQRVDMGPES